MAIGVTEIAGLVLFILSGGVALAAKWYKDVVTTRSAIDNATEAATARIESERETMRAKIEADRSKTMMDTYETRIASMDEALDRCNGRICRIQEECNRQIVVLNATIADLNAKVKFHRERFEILAHSIKTEIPGEENNDQGK